MPLQRIEPRERRAAAANDRLAVVPRGRLQVSHGVALPVERLVATPGPTLPQPHVDLLDAPLRWCRRRWCGRRLPAPRRSLVDRSRVLTTSTLRGASGW